MQRDLLVPLAIALLCVVAIAVASATLTDPASTTGFERDVGDGGDAGSGGQWNPLDLDLSDGEESGGGGGTTSIGPLCFPVLTTFRVQALLVFALAAFSVALYRRMGTIGIVAGLAAVLPPGLLLYTYFTTCGSPEQKGVNWGFAHGNASNATGAGGAAGTGGGGGAAVDPPIALLLVGGVLAVVLVAAFVRSTGDDAVEEEPEPEPEPDEEDLAAVANVAGEAADRIEGPADVENEVYRAWREMTGLLDVDAPESSTPAEFRAAALDAGMARDHVAALTDTFREVRYGGQEPTPDREERAVEALRAIEDAYAGEGQP